MQEAVFKSVSFIANVKEFFHIANEPARLIKWSAHIAVAEADGANILTEPVKSFTDTIFLYKIDLRNQKGTD